MSGNENRVPRDPFKSIFYYQTFIGRQQEAINAYACYNNPALFFSIAPKYVAIGRAAYSAGDEVSECYRWFGKAAIYQHRFLSEGKRFKLDGPGNIDDYLELYSAAFLSGESEELITALKNCTYTETSFPANSRLLAQFCDFLQGKPIEVTDTQVTELQAINKEWACLPALFSAVSAKDIPKAGAALNDYLANSWGAPIEKWAKKALKAPTPEYGGKWSIFSAAACRLLGTIPDLGSKAKLYVPIDLVSCW